jgi:hypothetical protein
MSHAKLNILLSPDGVSRRGVPPEPLHNEQLKQPVHINQKWEHLSIAQQMCGSCVVKEETAQRMQRLVILI